MSALPPRRALALGAALIGGAALLTPLGIAALRRSGAERVEPPAAGPAASASAAAALADAGELLLEDGGA
ncbi:MAG TPA: hypothetical protein VL242_44995, partial [Sorangium sp.]|nr:hypothetical protein [Sorangium sp.]